MPSVFLVYTDHFISALLVKRVMMQHESTAGCCSSTDRTHIVLMGGRGSDTVDSIEANVRLHIKAFSFKVRTLEVRGLGSGKTGMSYLLSKHF